LGRNSWAGMRHGNGEEEKQGEKKKGEAQSSKVKGSSGWFRKSTQSEMPKVEHEKGEKTEL